MGGARTASVDGLRPGVTYDFHVVAYDAQGLLSAPSNVVRYTVPGDGVPPGGGTDDGGDDGGGSDGGGDGGDDGAGGETPAVGTAYLAEGAQDGFFSTTLEVANPTTSWAEARLVLRPDGGDARTARLKVPPLGHLQVDAAAVLQGDPGAFGVELEGGAPLGLGRLVTWGRDQGGHAAVATREPSRRWYFAEGSTAAPFDLFYVVFNPGDTAAVVNATFLLPSGPPVTRRYKVAGKGRLTIWADQDVPELASTEVAAVIESVSGPAIVAERAMYLTGPKGYAGGHASLGVDAPRTRWLMADGATGSFFSLFVMLANPSSEAAEVRLTFRRPDGVALRHTVWLQPRQRKTVDVASLDPLLRDTSVWTEVQVGNGVPIVAERVMWWPGKSWTDGHVSAASTEPAARWLTVGGQSGGPQDHATFVTLANVGSAAQDVRLTVLGPEGPLGKTRVTVAPGGRFNVDVGAFFPNLTGGYSVLVETVSGARTLVVEQSVYWDALGQRWGAGTSSLAVALE